MSYLLDANVFIQAKQLHYGFDICPGFWDWLVRENKAGNVMSIEKVADELLGAGDDLSKWVAARGDRFFLKPDSMLIPALARTSSWVSSKGYTAAAVNTFLQVADSYLVAHALAHGNTVVTLEIPAPSVHKVKIPNACIDLKIKCITPYQMLRAEKARFVLDV